MRIRTSPIRKSMMVSVLRPPCAFFLMRRELKKFDSVHSTEKEDRWNVIGLVLNVLFVVYTERKDTIRIISARKATKEEENEYYEDYDSR